MMVSHNQVKLATMVVTGAAVLCLAGGAATASGAGSTTPVSAEMARLQATWGPHVIRTVQQISGSHAMLVGTRDLALLRSANPQQRLGSKYPVVVMFIRPPGSTHTTIDNRCASTTDIPMMEDFRDIG